MSFRETALLLTTIWLALVAIRYRRSTAVLVGGLVAVGGYSILSIARGAIAPEVVGLGLPRSWPMTLAFAISWLALMLAYSPLADWIASRIFAKPPTLDTFRAIQESKAKLVAGIVVAWLLGGFLEELIFRGVVLKSIAPASVPLAILVAAIGAGIIHLYQGSRAAVIITQLSVLFGILFVVSGYSLWTVMLCHGLYDTIAFIRFATGKSKYSQLSPESASQPRLA